MTNPIVTKLAGTTFHDHQQNLSMFTEPIFSTYNLYREPENPYDSNAVKVGLSPHFFGYIPKTVAPTVAAMMDEGKSLVAQFVSLNRHSQYETLGLTVKILEVIE